MQIEKECRLEACFIYFSLQMKRFIWITLLLCIIEFCLNAYVWDIPRTILWFLFTLINSISLAIAIAFDEFEKKFR